MQLYLDPISTTCRPILLFLAEHDLPVEVIEVNLMGGAHLAEEHTQRNPNQAVPVLAEGDFTLTEGSTILKYLADCAGSAAYPSDLKARAKVNQAMDWLNTGFYKDYGYGVVYAQTLPHHIHANPTTAADLIKVSSERSAKWLRTLNDHWLGKSRYLTGEEPTIADYMGACYVTIGDWVDYDLSPYPNVVRWVEDIRARPSWSRTHGAFDGLVAYIRSQRQAAAAAS